MSANYNNLENLKKSGFKSGIAVHLVSTRTPTMPYTDIVCKFRTEKAANEMVEKYTKNGNWVLKDVYFPEG